jgi:hypothetical protein
MKTKSVLFAAIVLFVVSLSATGGLKQPLTSHPLSAQNGVENRTTSLRINAVTPSFLIGRTVLAMSVQNISDKPIVEYTLVKQDGSSLSTSGATTGWELAPGAQDIVNVSILGSNSQKVVLSALLFEDGSGEGDPDEIAYFRHYRDGVRDQYTRALRIIQWLNNGRTNAAEMFRELSSILSSLPDDAETKALGVAAGMRAAKQFILGQLASSRKSLEKTGDIDPEVLKDDLDRVTAHAEKAIGKISKQAAHLER